MKQRRPFPRGKGLRCFGANPELQLSLRRQQEAMGLSLMRSGSHDLAPNVDVRDRTHTNLSSNIE